MTGIEGMSWTIDRCALRCTSNSVSAQGMSVSLPFLPKEPPPMGRRQPAGRMGLRHGELVVSWRDRHRGKSAAIAQPTLRNGRPAFQSFSDS